MCIFLKIVKKSDLPSVEFLNDLTKIMVEKVAKKNKMYTDSVCFIEIDN